MTAINRYFPPPKLNLQIIRGPESDFWKKRWKAVVLTQLKSLNHLYFPVILRLFREITSKSKTINHYLECHNFYTTFHSTVLISSFWYHLMSRYVMSPQARDYDLQPLTSCHVTTRAQVMSHRVWNVAMWRMQYNNCVTLFSAVWCSVV